MEQGRSGQLGALERLPADGRGRALDRAGLCPRRELRLLFPLAGGDDRPGADALRAAAPRRDARSRRRGGRRARDAGAAERSDTPARVALLHDYESLWIHDEQPHSERATYWRQIMLFYQALRSLGVDVDIRHPDHDLSGYDVIVAPAIQLMGPERADHLASYASDAILVFGPRTAYRTPTGRVQEDGQPGPLRELVGHRAAQLRRHATRADRAGRRPRGRDLGRGYRPTRGRRL